MKHPWQRSYPKDKVWDANIQAKPLPEILDFAVENFPDKDAIDFLNKKYTYSELSALVSKATLSFIKLGVKKGTKVAIFLPNCPYFVIAYFAILKAGGVVVNCSPLYSENELEYQLDDSDSEFLISLDINLLYPKSKNLLDKAKKENKKLQKIIICSLQKALPFPSNILYPIFKRKDKAKVEHSRDVISWDDFLDFYKEIDPDTKVKIDVEDTAVIQYTGGTTGTPKGAELTHKNLYVNTYQSKLYVIEYEDGTGSMLTCLPLFHVFAMTTAMNLGVATASTLILHPRFDVKKVLKDIDKKKPTGMPGVPAMYNAINNHKDLDKYDLKSLKICVSGGAPLPIEVKKEFEQLTGCNLIEGYGLTETSPVAVCNPMGGMNKEGSIGLPFPDTEILIEDIENPGKYLGSNERGELCIKGPQVMKGYYKKPEENKKVFNEDRVLKTGDVAIIDEDGYTFIVDRIKEMIIVGGFKVYPRTVEEHLYEHSDVLEAAVIGVKCDIRGEKVKAFIVPKKGKNPSKEDISAFLKDRLAKHEMPKEFEFLEELPKSPIGKILKKELT